MLPRLLEQLERGNLWLKKGDIKKGQLRMWAGATHARLRKLFGDDHELVKGTSNNPSFRIVPTRVFVKDQSEGIKRSI